MRKVYLFMMVSLDGFFEGKGHDLGWHNVDGEFNDFANRQLRETGTVLLGRRTYQLFADFWPKAGRDPKMPEDVLETARLLDGMEKVVFSRKMEKADWTNTKLVRKGVENEIARLKRLPGRDIAILGSNNLCVSLMKAGLVDEFRLMLNPVAIGKGTPLFKGLRGKLRLGLVKTKVFKSGNVLMYYRKR